MTSARILSRLLVSRNFHRLSIIGTNHGQIRQFWHHHHHHRRELPMISNVIERWAKEFDRMQEQFNNFFQQIKNNRILSNDFSSGDVQVSSNNNLIVTESDGSKKFHLSFNIHGFEPEEIKIKTQNGTIIISACKEKKANNSYALQEFSQTYALPEGIKLDDLKSTYTENGILTIEAPFLSVKDPPKERSIKIERA